MLEERLRSGLREQVAFPRPRKTREQVRGDLVLSGADPNCYACSLCLGLDARLDAKDFFKDLGSVRNWRRAAASPRPRRTVSPKLCYLLGLADGHRLHPVPGR